MKVLYPLLSVITIAVIGFSAYGLYSYGLLDNIGANNNNTNDGIFIDSVEVTDPGIRCFTTPCTFFQLDFNVTIRNSIERDLGVSSSDNISIKLVTGSEWFNSHEKTMNYPWQSVNNTLPVGTWQFSYSTILRLYRMPSSNEKLPNTVDIQLILGDNVLSSSIYRVNLI